MRLIMSKIKISYKTHPWLLKIAAIGGILFFASIFTVFLGDLVFYTATALCLALFFNGFISLGFKYKNNKFILLSCLHIILTALLFLIPLRGNWSLLQISLYSIWVGFFGISFGKLKIFLSKPVKILLIIFTIGIILFSITMFLTLPDHPMTRPQVEAVYLNPQNINFVFSFVPLLISELAIFTTHILMIIIFFVESGKPHKRQ